MSASRRPVSPGAEEILGLYFPVLDHGFVALVDYMGTDECIERAARVSYGYGTRKAQLTRGLLRYLRRHLHTTPSEMVELKFHCCMPIFVARQWIRHRTACLAGDTRLHLDLPSNQHRGRRRRENGTIEALYRDFTKGFRQRVKLRCCDERTGEITHTHLVDVWQSGVKPVFRVTLENGRSLTMSKDHRCLTERGWLTLEQATGLRRSSRGVASWRNDAPAFAVNGEPAYRSREWLAARCDEGLDVTQIAERAGVSHHSIRKCLARLGLGHFASEKARDRLSADDLALESLNEVDSGGDFSIFQPGRAFQPRPAHELRGRTVRLVRAFSKVARIEYAGEQMTYDLEVAGPFHNFVANGFIVHNSVNEYSGRYSLMPMLFYTPSQEQLQKQSRDNNQGRSGESVPAEQYQAAVRRWNEIRQRAQSAYEWMTHAEIARELARIDLPLSTYTQWYWKIDLHNLQHFLKLRVDRHAQWEIQEYGRIMAGMLKKVVPLSYEAWIDYDVCGTRMSRMELDALRALLSVSAERVESKAAALDRSQLEALGLSRREIAELVAKLEPTVRPDFELDLSRAVPAEVFEKKMMAAVPSVAGAPEEPSG